MRRQRRHEEIDKNMNEIRQKQHDAKMVNDLHTAALVVVAGVVVKVEICT